MNVLIVDDQPEVVESMVTGVNWKKIPVEQVFTAYSVKAVSYTHLTLPTT